MNELSEKRAYDSLLELLHQLGVRTAGQSEPELAPGFPVSVPLSDGKTLVLELPGPGALANLDPDGIGVAVVDALGYVRRTWGLARRLPHFRPNHTLLETPLGPLFEESFHGSYGSLYLDGFRYFGGGLSGAASPEVFLLVVNAQEERTAKRQASKSWRAANALKRLGKALTMNQSRQDLAISACHVIASTAELAAVLLWTLDADRDVLELSTSVGANRQAAGVLSQLSLRGGSSCVAELVADTREPFYCADVSDSLITSNLEAKFCYLKPRGVCVHPLVIQDRLIGVLELVGRDSDLYFGENLELFETIAEHLALAMNSAMLFENFEKWATHDALTGLANHRRLHEFLQQRISEAERTEQEVGVIMLDVDHFRAFNEEEGHDAGDEVLRLVSDAIRSCLRPYDLAGRYGGEEFTVVMPGASETTTLTIAERIRERVHDAHYHTKSGHERTVTVSLGCACYPGTAHDPATVLKAADTALYDSKRSGRNRVTLYEGRYRPPSEPRDPKLEKAWACIPKQDRVAADRRMALLAPLVDNASRNLTLSPSQREILVTLLAVAPTYRRWIESNATAKVQSVEGKDEFRSLLPHLHALSERFDGKGARGLKGAKIPLLARVVVALLDFELHGELSSDGERFDPEVLNAIRNERRAA